MGRYNEFSIFVSLCYTVDSLYKLISLLEMSSMVIHVSSIGLYSDVFIKTVSSLKSSIVSSSFSNSLLRLYLVLYFPYSVCGRPTRKAVHSFTRRSSIDAYRMSFPH